MDDYISKKDILQMIESTAMWNRSFSVLYEDIEDMKPSDVSPVRHGRWIPAVHVGDCCYRCSECQFLRDTYLIDIGNYCPKCGAKMNDEVAT